MPRAARQQQDSPKDKSFRILLEYITLAHRSATAPRVIFLFLIFSSVVSFFGNWNARDGSWINTRLRVFRNALDWRYREPPTTQATAEETEAYSAAKRLYEELGLRKTDDLKELILVLEEMKTQGVRTIHIPVLGVVFDVNDLGIFSGVVFVVALLMYRFSLARELQNIRVAHRRAEMMDTERCELQQIVADNPACTTYRRLLYELLSMGQVMVVTPGPVPAPWHWQHACKVGIFFPFVVQLLILVTDLMSHSTGLAMSVPSTLIVLMTSFACLVIVGILIYSSLNIWRAMETFWLDLAKELRVVNEFNPWSGDWHPGKLSLP